MKIIFQYIAFILICVAGVSCKKDNYDEPSSRLTGRIVYQGVAIGVENYQVPYELYQFGFGKVGPIGSSFGQDGTFSALLFDGEYKLIVPNGQGPFLWKKTAGGAPDTITISLKGNQNMDIDVMPYYMIRNAQLTGGAGQVKAAFKVEKIITDANARDIENVTLFINKTQFVSRADNENIATAGIDGPAIVDPNNISLTVTVPGMTPAQNYVFARIGVKIAGVEDRLYSPVQKITF
ncbi:DUF3823 domain-containing protein [Paraflavitalea soli]|uniref:DUF3823 domain-containing protein n=1 Tax=Paraflavitalea soli TaxID=2315862 RepID=A0A3B7MLE7_9BACT|nr:DUF3823 domain-containing protein [Paraflavitalea soli]AXY75038.1 DUF3823 domain-containing protein [Paraflavitalea soli]